MSMIDVLMITALPEEHDAVLRASQASLEHGIGVANWEEKDIATPTPYLLGQYVTSLDLSINIALARPTRMGGTATSPVAASLVERLKPRCLAMCGVCAGNPDEVALGDVIIAEMVYPYDEGKQKEDGFEGDHRQAPMLDDWVRLAQDLTPDGLPSFGEASEEEAMSWLLERLYAGEDPRKHPARTRYFPPGKWRQKVQELENQGLVLRDRLNLVLTEGGRSIVEERMLYDVEGPTKLPFQIKVGPIASGNVVVKDGLTWEKLKKWGVRSVLGLEMEAATIGSVARRLKVPSWVVAKGVMDHADPRKDDRYKPFAARASAEVIFKFLSSQLPALNSDKRHARHTLAKSVFVIGSSTGETEYPLVEKPEFERLCLKLGESIAHAGADLVACSPFGDSADVFAVLGYMHVKGEGNVYFHSPRHRDVDEMHAQLRATVKNPCKQFIYWNYPSPENEESWSQAWLLCQLQALEHADLIIAIGGKVSKTANTLLHLAELRGIPMVPFAFFGGASERAFRRRDWQRLHPGLNYKALLDKETVGAVMEIADQIISDRIRGTHTLVTSPKLFFISRASSDSAYAERLAEHLGNVGLTPLLGDDAVQADRMVQPSIEEAILKSDVCIILWSRAYALSRWCNDELELALERESVGELRIWLFNLDGTDVVPRRARALPQAIVRTPQALVEAVRNLL